MNSKLNLLPKIEIKSTSDLRQWLLKNHQQTKQSYWLVSYKKNKPEYYVSWSDMVDELLCFGWIDGQSRKLDEHRTMHLISRRNPKSGWSKINKDKIKILLAENRMQPSGLDAINIAKQNGAWEFLDDIEQGIIPDDLQRSFNNHPIAHENFIQFPHSSKRAILAWVKTAKTQETRAKRIALIVQQAEQNIRIR